MKVIQYYQALIAVIQDEHKDLRQHEALEASLERNFSITKHSGPAQFCQQPFQKHVKTHYFLKDTTTSLFSV